MSKSIFDILYSIKKCIIHFVVITLLLQERAVLKFSAVGLRDRHATLCLRLLPVATGRDEAYPLRTEPQRWLGKARHGPGAWNSVGQTEV